MNTEQLMKPRFKVINDYPGAISRVGDLFMIGYLNAKQCWILCRDGKTVEHSVHGPENYPHLFKQLDWWEDRDEKDMPEFFKINHSSRVVKSASHFVGSNKNMFEVAHKNGCVFYDHVTPATQSEYDNQQPPLK